MITSIHQPDYIPYVGYFYKIARAETFVFLDNCQFSSDNMHHWNSIKTPQGVCRLKIPLEHKFGDCINQVRTKDELKWKEKHLKTIEMNYKKAKHFDDFFPIFKELLTVEYANLADMNIAINTWICAAFGFHTKLLKASQMPIDTVNERRVIDICRYCGADKYISGNGARAYQTEKHFLDQGVVLEYTDFQPFEYAQTWNKFVPNLSIIDYICNCGFDWDFIVKKLKNK